jgi:hypothetical protein
MRILTGNTIAQDFPIHKHRSRSIIAGGLYRQYGGRHIAEFISLTANISNNPKISIDYGSASIKKEKATISI